MHIKMKGLRSYLLVTKPEDQSYSTELSVMPELKRQLRAWDVRINDVPGFGYVMLQTVQRKSAMTTGPDPIAI